ncbi:MAG TPA: sulfatase-like hydrolase/transferase [Myxococcota bacterium]|nr:sulfatase-like hydrolase/transferase [Myxococcota bacterium]
MLRTSHLAALLGALSCAPTDDPSGPGDPPSDDSGHADPVEVHVTPDPAWGDQPLRCASSRPGAPLQWLRDGVPWDGATTTDAPGDTIPASALAAHQTWTCVAAGGGIGVDHVTILPPDVIVVLADDLGYGDLAAYGGPTPTPRLDTLAAQGVRFTEAYAAAPVCSPSRAGLVTGRQPSRFGFEYNVLDDPTGVARGLPVGERTLADRMRALGYRTELVGKWHLGFSAAYHPNARGFDHFFGFLNGRRPSLQPGIPGVVEYEVSPEEVASWPASPGGWQVEQDGATVTLDERHLTDRFADEAVARVLAPHSQPLFLMLAFNAVHLPLQATPEQLARVERPESAATWAYRANVAALDDAVGRVLDALDDAGVAEHTLVVFASDNGCPSVDGFCSNGGLAGGKLLMTEGGLRIPLVVRWPGHVPAGEARDGAVSLLDVLPTVIGAAGGSVAGEAIDGVDLLPWLTDAGAPPPHDVLYWRMLPVRAIREGAEKLVDSTTGTWRFDLATDPNERRDLQLDDPPRSRALADELDARARLYVPPLWLGQPATVDYYGTQQNIVF